MFLSSPRAWTKFIPQANSSPLIRLLHSQNPNLSPSNQARQMNSTSICLLFFAITPFLISIAAQSRPELSRALDLFPSLPRRNLLSHTHQNLEPYQDKLLVALPDGTIVLVQEQLGDTIWSLSTGRSLSSMYQSASDKENNSLVDDDDGYKVDVADVLPFVPIEYDGDMNLMQVIENYFNGGSCIGIKKYTLFIIDPTNGKLIEVIDPSEGVKASSGIKTTDLENGQQLFVKRTDYALVLFSEHKVQWNLTFSRIEASLLHQERKQQVRVVHFRESKYVRFLLDISRQNHKDAKSLGAPESNQNYAYSVDAGSTAQNSMALMVVGKSDQNDTSCVTTGDRLQHVASHISGKHNPVSKMSHYIRRLQYLPLLLGVLLLILWYSGNIAITRKNISKQLNSSSGKNKVPSKRKKARKSGTNTKSNAKGISDDDLEKSHGRNDKEPWSYLEIPVNAQGNGRMIGKLFISNTEIAKGSNGTVVIEGRYDGRPVAVKRLVQAYHDVAFKEIQNLIASDQHPNIVRWYGVEYDVDFVYLSLERCTCTLGDLIKKCSDSFLQPVCTQEKILSSTKGIDKHVELWKASGYPSPQLLKLMRDIVSGLVHLHELGIIHRDLKPQNILIINEKSLCAKLSDMGISKRLLEDKSSLGCHPTGCGSSGWQAPEQLLHGRQTRAVDLFGLGCVLFFCITGGKHPYGDHLERDINIIKNRVDLFMVEHIPEAMDLFSQLLDPKPELRPTALHVLHHPLFWSSETRLSFLRDASDRVELEDRESESDLLKELENVGPVALGGNWSDKMEANFINNIGRYRRYKFDSTRDLLRVMRNKLNHYRELPKEIQELLGPVPEGFDGYFSSRFPKFLIEVYKVLYRYCREEEWFCKYFRTV